MGTLLWMEGCTIFSVFFGENSGEIIDSVDFPYGLSSEDSPNDPFHRGDTQRPYSARSSAASHRAESCEERSPAINDRSHGIFIPRSWCPTSLAKLVQITSITMVYGWYMYIYIYLYLSIYLSILTLFINQLLTGGTALCRCPPWCWNMKGYIYPGHKNWPGAWGLADSSRATDNFEVCYWTWHLK